MSDVIPKTKEKEDITTNPFEVQKLTDQSQWKTVVSNFYQVLNAKFPPKTKAIEPQGLKVK